MECNFCKKSFSSKGNLLSHQKTAKYCLELQGKHLETEFSCDHCSKHFTQKTSLSDHVEICKERRKKIQDDIQHTHLSYIKKLEAEIVKLKRVEKENIKKIIEEKDILYQKDIKTFEDKLKEKNEYIVKLEARLDKFENVITSMAAEPKNSTKTTNNVIVNNILNLSTEHVTKVLDEHFTKEVVANGQKGLAKMVCEKMLTGPDGKLSYKCVDPSRHTFEFINDEGDIERDIKAKKLTKALINSNIQQKAAEVGNTIWTKEDGHVDSDKYNYCSQKVLELACLEKDDSKFRSELSALTS